MHLDQCQVRSWSTNISWIVNFVAANCKSCTVYFGLVWLQFTNKFGVGYIFPPVFWSLVFADKKYCIRALDSATYSLRESSKFVGGGMHPHFAMFWVSYQFPVLQQFSRLFVKYLICKFCCCCWIIIYDCLRLFCHVEWRLASR